MYHKTTGKTFSIWPVYYYDPDVVNLYIWKNGSTYIRSEFIGDPVETSEASALPSGFIYNTKPFYEFSSGTFPYLWYDSIGDQWVLSAYLGHGNVEIDYGEDEDPRWGGDAWYSLSGSTVNGTYVPRGTYKNTAAGNETVSFGIVEGWESSTLTGEYTPISGSSVTGTFYVGWNVLTDGENFFTEAALEYNNEKFYEGTTKTIWNDGALWILSSTKGLKTEPYWSSADLLGSYAITGSGSPSSYTISHSSYEEGSETTDAYIAQVALWL